MITTTYSCDVCKKTLTLKEAQAEKKMQVIFVTEQTEGYPSKPYFTLMNMHICPSCISKCLEGNYLFAKGAQGYNDFYFKDTK